jgi:hypothetical protein
MAQPTIGNTSVGDGTGVDTITFSHTAESGKTIYLLIGSSIADLFNIFDYTATFGGVSLNIKFNWAESGLTNKRMFVFSLTNPTPGTDDIVFSTTAAAANISAIAFNVADGPVNGDIILPGAYTQYNVDTLTRTGYGWDADGIEIGFVWGNLGAPSIAIDGTAIDTGNGLAAGWKATADGNIDFTATRGDLSNYLSLGTFLIPPGNQSLTSGTYQPLFGGEILLPSLVAGSSAYAGLPYATATSSFGRQGNIFPTPGTLKSWAVKSSVPPGTGNEITVELLIGGQSDQIGDIGSSYFIHTGITLTISGDTATLDKADGIDLSHYRYERLSIIATNTGAGTLPADFAITVAFLHEPGIADEQVYGGGSQAFGSPGVDDPFDRAPLHPADDSTWGTFPDSEKCLIGIECTLDEYIANYQVSTTLDPDHQFYIKVYRFNGTGWDAPQLQDGTGGSIDTEGTLIPNTTAQALARWKGSLSLHPLDFISVTGFVRNAGSAFLRQ